MSQLAFDNGYYDQSHFIHDFKSLTGLTPKVFFAGKK
jgi:AraC-like DNA-binding protein